MCETAQNNPSPEHLVYCYILQQSSQSAAKVGNVQLEGAMADMHISGYVLCTQVRELLSGERC